MVVISRIVHASPGRRFGTGPTIICDIAPFRSPVDGSMVTSRKDRREHNERHGVVDVGNDPAFQRLGPATQPWQPDEGEIVEDIKASMHEHGWGD